MGSTQGSASRLGVVGPHAGVRTCSRGPPACPPMRTRRAPHAVQVQLGEVLKTVVYADYPEKWPGLLQALGQNLVSQVGGLPHCLWTLALALPWQTQGPHGGLKWGVKGCRASWPCTTPYSCLMRITQKRSRAVHAACCTRSA